MWLYPSFKNSGLEIMATHTKPQIWVLPFWGDLSMCFNFYITQGRFLWLDKFSGSMHFLFRDILHSAMCMRLICKGRELKSGILKYHFSKWTPFTASLSLFTTVTKKQIVKWTEPILLYLYWAHSFCREVMQSLVPLSRWHSTSPCLQVLSGKHL